METHKVYIVDDDDNVRRSMTFLLAAHDLDSRAFRNGEDLLEAERELGPGCILLDVHLPNLSGLEVQAELVRRGSRLPVILMTGSISGEKLERARELGAIAVLPKPFSEEDLCAALKECFCRLAPAEP